MIKTPAHKQTDPAKAPGQVSFDRYPYMKHSTADQTLGDYITRTSRAQALDDVAAEKKLTFEGWYARNEHLTHNKTEYDCMKLAWNAAQENK